MPVVPALAWARLRYRPARWLLVALGVAAAMILPVLAQDSATIVAAQAVRYGVAQLDPGQRSLVASTYGLGLDQTQLGRLNNEVDGQLAPLAAKTPRAELLYRRLAGGTGGEYFLGAADHLSTAVHITAGRAPASCTPQRCEVVVVGTGTPTLDPALGVVVVGRAVRTDPLLLTGPFATGNDVPLLLGDGVARVTQIAALQQYPRTYGWVTPIDLTRVQHLGVDAYLARSAQATENLQTSVYAINLAAPDDTLRDQDDRAQRSARRFALLSGSATALLLGFAAIGAIGLRREHAAVTELLRRRGSSRRSLAWLTAIESGAPVAIGAVAGVLIGLVLAAARAASAGLPAWSAAGGAVRAAGLTVLLGAVAAWLLVAAVRSWPAATNARYAWRAVDLAVVAGLAVVTLALSRGAVTVTALSDRTDPLLLALPVVFVVCGGLVVGRIWPALVGRGARLLPRSRLAGRLGLLGALRRPLRPVATVAFFAAATGIVVFAAGYQATLRQGATEQAAFAVPGAATIAVGPSLVQPLALVSPAGLARAVPGVAVHPVLRADAGIKLNAAETLTASVLGVDPAMLADIPSWDHVVGGPPAAVTARKITTSAVQTGFLVPAGSTQVSLAGSGNLAEVDVTAWLRSALGRDIGVPLTTRGTQLTAAVPPGAAGWHLFAFTLSEDPHYATIEQHHLGEGGNAVTALSGTAVFGVPQFVTAATGDAVPDWTGWGSSSATASASGANLSVKYAFTGQRIVVRAGAATPFTPLPVLADPVTAKQAGNKLLPLSVSGNEPILARVVAVAPRFPTLGSRFVVADAGALANQLDAHEPGSGSVAELWLTAPSSSSAALSRALTAAPYDQLSVTLRQEQAERLAADPLARGAASLLSQSALLALVIAVLSVVLLVIAERRDESAELYAWETDGLPPGTLRMSLFARACAVVAVAVPGGLLIGLALSTVTTRLVTVTAVGTTPTPPLFLAIGPVQAAAVIVGGVALGLAAAGAVAAGALRESLPARPIEEL